MMTELHVGSYWPPRRAMLYLEEWVPHIDSPLQEPHPRHASATIATTEREYIPPKPPTRNILPRGSPHKRTPIGQRAGVMNQEIPS